MKCYYYYHYYYYVNIYIYIYIYRLHQTQQPDLKKNKEKPVAKIRQKIALKRDS